MNKSNLLQAQIQILPSNELEIFYPKPSLKYRLFSKENLRGTIVYISSLIVSIVLTALGIYEHVAIVAFTLAVLELPFIIRGKGIQKILFEKKGLITIDFNKEVRKYNFENIDSIDFKVKIIDDTVELRIEEHTIYFDDVKQLPLVIDHITTKWDLEYYETKQVNHEEILTYRKNWTQ